MQSKEEVKQQMFGHIEQWQQSGLTQKGFCEQSNVPYHVFHYWYKRYRNQGNNVGSSFIKLDVPPGIPSNALHVELLLPDGKRLLFYQPLTIDYLKALIN